jgi:hypothetical protein
VATIYNTTALNDTGKIVFGLANDVTVTFRSLRIPLYTGNDIYNMPLPGIKYFFAYIQANNYRLVRKSTKEYMQFLRVAFTNTNDTMVYLLSLPGPRCVGFRHIYEPQNSLVYKGKGATVLSEVSVSLPRIQAQRSMDLNFSPSNGALWHRPSHHYPNVNFVEIYRMVNVV